MPLLQYVSEHYAKYIWQKPVTVTPQASFLGTGNGSSDHHYWQGSARYVARRGGENAKKFILVELDRFTIVHPMASSLNTDFVHVSTVNPFESDPMVAGRTMNIWVQANWVEPLTRHGNYEREHKAKALRALKERWGM